MSEDKGEKLTHGFNIKSEHHSALDFMGSHMNEEQVKDMVHRAESGHSAHFMVTHDGQHSNFKLEHHDGKLVVHEAHHG